VPITLHMKAVIIPTWAPAHHPSALPKVAPSPPMSFPIPAEPFSYFARQILPESTAISIRC
jgi:hypothetical protein